MLETLSAALGLAVAVALIAHDEIVGYSVIVESTRVTLDTA